MTPIEAIQILDQVSSKMQMNRVDHSRAIEAVQVLQNMVKADLQAKNVGSVDEKKEAREPVNIKDVTPKKERTH